MNRFRPQEITKRHTIRLRLQGYGNEWINYNWQSRVEWWPCGYGSNKKTIAKQFKRLHYLACHAPSPIQKKWRVTYNNFMIKHFGASGKGTMRYLNRWSCHSWL